MGYRIAVVGATGNIGRELLNVLAEREMVLDSVVALASSRSTGTQIDFGDRDEDLIVKNLQHFDFAGYDLAFFAVPQDVAALHAPRAASQGCVVIDVSAQFRTDADVPLVVPDVNAVALKGYSARNIVALPQAISAQLASVLAPLHEEAPIKRVVVATYQAVSEAGRVGMDELFEQTRGIFVNDTPTAKVFSQQIAFNVIPHIGAFGEDGSTQAEALLAQETVRVLANTHPAPKIAVTCVQVPVFVGHSMAIAVEFAAPLTEFQARAQLRSAPGVMVVDKRETGGTITPVETSGEFATYVSRIRKDTSVAHGVQLWCVADNLRKNVALNAVQSAELLGRRYLKKSH
jgi:aspartate-semialdehyde dehydrogenase